MIHYSPCIFNKCLVLTGLFSRCEFHKSENIFLYNEQSVVKLGDFGIAKILHKTDSFAQTMIGTPYYFSPELCENKPYKKMTGKWSHVIPLNNNGFPDSSIGSKRYLGFRVRFVRTFGT